MLAASSVRKSPHFPTLGLASLRRSLRRRLLGRGKPRPAAEWDAQYREGSWDGIATETGRHACVAALVRRFAPEGRLVLDVGCGQGALAGQLRGDAGSRYVGLDISAEAIRRAGEDTTEGESFQAVDVEAGPPSFLARGSVDAAVFSEVLYYLDDPLATLRLFAPLLSARGFFVFSLWRPSRHRALRRRLSREYDERHAVEIGGEGGEGPGSRGDAWRISVCVPAGRAARATPTGS
jgi:SAM-dependent methyltransferase